MSHSGSDEESKSSELEVNEGLELQEIVPGSVSSTSSNTGGATAKPRHEEASDDDESFQVKIIREEDEVPPPPIKNSSGFRQFRALFIKNLSLQKRRKCTNCFQLCIPLSVILLIGFINLLVLLFGGISVERELREEQPNQMGSPNSAFPYFLYAEDEDLDLDLGEATVQGNKSGFWGQVNQYCQQPYDNEGNPIPDTVCSWLPFAVQVDSKAAIDTYLLQLKEDILDKLNSPREQDYDDQTTVVPVAALLFQTLDNVTMELEYEAMYETEQPFVFDIYSYGGDQTPFSSTIATIHDAFVREFMGSFSILHLSQAMPYYTEEQDFDITGLLCGLLLPFAMSFLLPVFVHNIVQEKQEKLIEMMKMMGLKMYMYQLINFIYDLVVYFLISLLVIIIGLIFQLRFFTQTSPIILILLFLGWGLNQISFAFVLSTLFSKTRTATILLYILVISTVIASIAVNLATFNTSEGEEAHIAYLLYPPFAFYRGIWLIGAKCTDSSCPPASDLGGSEWINIMLVLYLEIPLFLLLSSYLDQVLPREFGVQKSPFFPFTALWKLIRKKGKKDQSTDLLLATSGDTLIENEDPDVSEERKKVDSVTQKDLRDYPVLIKNLQKRYADKVAVVDLCLTLKNNECFGLLGPNGAGKTTTISILTGLYMPTKGNAWVGGYKISTDMDSVHNIMGVCPQFDTLWDTLTCRETLLFYVRLKGAQKKDENDMVNTYLKQVELLQAADMKVSELSGGMRRRLSVAVALVGDPPVIFLDEPTTGLDPDTRRSLWDVLLKLKKNKCVVLTTHSMEEADILCTRIGIMSHGVLQCCGSNTRLKNKYGQGYSLKVNFNPEDEQDVVAYVKQLAPSSVLQESLAGNYSYSIPSSDLVMSTILASLLKDKGTNKINDWGISQTTLEDVFLNIVKNAESD